MSEVPARSGVEGAGRGRGLRMGLTVQGGFDDETTRGYSAWSQAARSLGTEMTAL